MLERNVIYRIDCGSTTFSKSYEKLPSNIQKEVKRAIAELTLMDVTKAPAKLHFHNLKNKKVPSVLDPTKKVPVYTIHVTSNDAYKASFTLEDGTAYFRMCDSHDEIDKNP